MMDHVSHLNIETEGAAMLVLAGVELMFKAKPRWSEADRAVMREHYPKGGLVAVRTLLPHKTEGAIYQMARELKLSAPGYKRQTERWMTTPHIDAAIRRYYSGTPRKGGLSKLAHQMGRPASWVSTRARQLGCAPPRFRELPWSDRELQLLRDNGAKIPVTIARILHKHGFRRTSGAVSNKLVQLHCDRSDDDHYSATSLAGLFGVAQPVVTGWIKRGWIKAKTKGTTREHDIFRIHRNAVRRFVIENAGAIDLRRVEKHWFIDMMAGGE
jgi:hypothetical protein